VGEIEELARHFRGEGGASLQPRHGIYLPGQGYGLHASAMCRIQQTEPLMSALGQKQTWQRIPLMSALPPKADIG
jgi:hypothetical protein